ncbi:MAG: TonB-dependent receptor [Gemmatimonadota bacterium]
MRPTRFPVPAGNRIATTLTALLAAVALPASPGTAQEPGSAPGAGLAGSVEGTVVEAESGRPVASATVVLEPRGAREGTATPDGSTGGGAKTTWTDSEGRYRFADVAPGWYRLGISRIGYRPTSLWVELPEAWSVRRNLGLEVEPVALRAIAVAVPTANARWSASRGDRRAASPATSAFGASSRPPTLDSRALSSADVVAMSTLGEPDVLRALQRLPGASGQGDHSAGLWTRGTTWGMTRILLDGLPLYHPLHMGGTTSGMPAAGLEAVLFHPGVRPAALAEGAAGTVNLVTRRASSDGRIGASLSPLALSAHAEDRWLEDRVGMTVTARRSWWDKVDPPDIFTGESGGSGPVDYWLADALGRLDVRLGDWGMVEAAGLWEQDRLDGEIGTLVGASEGRWGNRLGWVAVAGARGSVRARLTAGRTVHQSDTRPFPWASFYDDRGVPTLDPMSLRLARTLVRLEVGGGDDRVQWNAGMDRARQTLRQRGLEASDREAPGLHDPASVGWVRLWGQGTVRLGPALVSLGTAWDAPAEGDPSGLGAMPNASVRFDVTERLTLELARGLARQFAYPLAAAGRSFGPALGVGQVWMLAGDGRSPLTSDLATASAQVRLDGGFGLALTGWRRAIDGISMSGVSRVEDGAVVPVYLDGSEGREEGRGFEATLWRREGRVQGEMGYSFARSRLVGPDGSRWYPPSDRRHSVDLLVSVEVVRALRAGAAFRAESGWPYVLSPWACADDVLLEDGDCDIPPGDPRRPLESSVHRADRYESLDLMVDWTRPGERVSWGATLALRNVLGRDNWTAWRPEGCSGTELISVACEEPVGLGKQAYGLTGPTPAFSVRVLF